MDGERQSVTEPLAALRIGSNDDSRCQRRACHKGIGFRDCRGGQGASPGVAVLSLGSGIDVGVGDEQGDGDPVEVQTEPGG